MPPPIRFAGSLILAVALIALPQTLAAQQITGEKQTTLLTAAKAQYYNLRMAGVKSFHCDVEPDWPALFTSIAGKPLADDDPMMKFLNSARIRFTNDLAGAPTVDWVNTGTPPEGREQATDQIKGGLKQMLEGFLTSLNPSLNGTLISSNPKAFASTAGGYVMDDSKGKETDQITFDKDLKITHLYAKTDEIGSQVDTTFSASPKGLLLTGMEAAYRQPPTSPPVHVVMLTSFEPVDDYLLPTKLSVTVTNVITFKMKFTGCSVQKAQ